MNNNDQSFATFSSTDLSGGMTKSQRRMMTKNDVFATTGYQKNEMYQQPSVSDLSTTGDDQTMKRDSTYSKREDPNILNQSLFTGTFDENIGVVTSKAYEEMKRKGRADVNPSEQARQYAEQNQALAFMMPEDAGMVYGDVQ